MTRDSTRLTRSANSLVQSTNNEHNNFKVQINSWFGQNLFTLTCLVRLCSQLPYRKSLIVYFEVKLGIEQLISGLPKQAEINRKTGVSVHNNNNMEQQAPNQPKLRTPAFCTCKSCSCPTRSLPVDCAQVVQLPAQPTEKQSKASIIEHPPFPASTHALLQGRAQTRALTSRNYTLE